MSGLTPSRCDRALPPEGGAPDWVHLFPAGRMKARDGREFDLADPAAVILAFQDDGIDLPVDYEHQNDKEEARLNGPIPAAGWIKELSHNESGLWGRVEWTATARELIERKEYRFLSPSFLKNKVGQIMRVTGAGLVHRPALHLKALASQELPMDQTEQSKAPQPSRFVQRLASLLKLAPDATEEDVLATFEAWVSKVEDQPDPKKFVPAEAVAQLLKEHLVEKASLAEGQVTEKVNAAIRGGYFTNALRDWAVTLCRSDPDSFDAFIQRTIPPYAHMGKPLMRSGPPMTMRPIAQSDAEATICAQLGLKPEQLA